MPKSNNTSSDVPLSIIQPYGPNASTCGYCGPPGVRSLRQSSHTFGVDGIQLSCPVYQKMIDRGWRRSGEYLYKPDLARTCCPQYTIRLNALEFQPSRSQRKLVYRFNRFVLGNKLDDKACTNKSKGNDSKFSLLKELHASEKAFSAPPSDLQHKFEVTLERSSFTEEKFNLYCKYQTAIHNDEDNAVEGFIRFLCDTPLKGNPIPYGSTKNLPGHLPLQYGSYHQMYRLDGALIAMGVVRLFASTRCHTPLLPGVQIDILPACVSSVYLMYDPDHDVHSLGKLSALREISLVQEIRQHLTPVDATGVSAGSMRYLYMGFYVHTCPKMKYKGEYTPSFLLEPEEYTWHSLSECLPLLDKHRYVPFAHPERATRPMHPTDGESPTDLKTIAKPALKAETLKSVSLVKKISNGRVQVVRAPYSKQWKSEYSKNLIVRTVQELGDELATSVIFKMSS